MNNLVYPSVLDYYPGPYENRVNLTLNGTLIINSVKSSDTAYYKCTVKRIIKYVSPLTYFVALKVNTTGKFIIFV